MARKPRPRKTVIAAGQNSCTFVPDQRPDRVDEYTQDIGGACVNLSTPNRTLSESCYHANVFAHPIHYLADYILQEDNDLVESGSKGAFAGDLASCARHLIPG
jgi:hypothetical protein